MNVICLEDEAFYKLMDDLFERLSEKYDARPDKWVDTDEAMNILKIRSKTTLQKLRDEGKIRYSQPQQRIIVYDRDSLNEYLEHHAKDTF